MKKAVIAVLTSAALLSGCTTMVANDYPAYLANNTGTVQAPKLNTVAHYTLSDATRAHSFKVKSFSAGLANSWYVELGKMLDSTLQSTDYSSQFSSQDNQNLDVAFDLGNYEFKNFQTYLTMNVKVSHAGKEVLSKSYTTVGKNQTGKVMVGGAFAMKNAIQQSTKAALDDILNQLLQDLKSQNIAVSRFVTTQAS